MHKETQPTLPAASGATTNMESSPGTDSDDKNDDNGKLEETVKQVVENTEEKDEITLRDIMESFERQAFGPPMLILSLIVISPIGAIPLVPTIFGCLIGLLAVQLAFRRSFPWLPNFVMKKSFSREKLTAFTDRVKPWLCWVDKFIYERMVFLVRGPMVILLAITCLILCISMVPLEVIPYAVTLPAGALLLFSTALTSSDGLLALLGYILAGSVGWFAYAGWPF